MGVDIRWFNLDKREFVDLGNRYGFTGHPSACVVYCLLRGPWNGDRIAAHGDPGDEFFDLPRAGYKDVTRAAFAEYDRIGCYCVPGETPDDPRPDPAPPLPLKSKHPRSEP